MELDNPIWQALVGRQAGFAVGGPRARRFPPALTTLAGLIEPDPESFRALAGLLGAGESAALFLETAPEMFRTGSPVGSPGSPGWSLVQTDRLVQMVQADPLPPLDGSEAVVLGLPDLEAMLALTALTQPGPFGRRTLEFGRYLGFRQEGALVAMAGERLRLPGHTEISAVCTAPAHQGRGLAGLLVRRLCAEIHGRGELPFLHVRAHNQRAISVYRRLGFAVRRELQLAVVAGPEARPPAAATS